MADAEVVIVVGTNDQQTRDDVMAEHLVVVFSLLLDVQHKDLLKPEAYGDEIVSFEQGCHWEIGPSKIDVV